MTEINPDYDFGDHEVTHTASIVFELFGEKIRDHPKMQENKEALKAAEYITDLLHAFYCSAAGKQLEPTSQEESMSKITPKDKTFLEYMFNDLDTIECGTDEEVRQELLDMKIDVGEVKKRLQKLLDKLVASQEEKWMEEEWRIYLKEKAPKLYQQQQRLEHDLGWRNAEIERLRTENESLRGNACKKSLSISECPRCHHIPMLKKD